MGIFVCYREEEPVARAIAVVNPKFWEKYGKKTAFWGFFESENDQKAVTTLFTSIETYCKEKSAEYLEGPFNPNHYSELGLLVENFDRPAFFETYNPEYYAPLIQGAGFSPSYRIYTCINRDSREFAHTPPPADYLNRAKKEGFTIRPFNLLHMQAELDRIREVYNDAFSENWHFLPVSKEEYQFSAQGMFLVTNPSLVQIVEQRGKPVGVLQCVLNINPILAPLRGRISLLDLPALIWKRLTTRELVLYAVGVKKACRHGQVTLLLFEAFRKMARRYRVLYTTWMTKDNPSAAKGSENARMAPYKWFALFGKAIIP